jgi:hypothetical protein
MAYGDGELRRLNRSRVHRVPFSPYGDGPHDSNRTIDEE